jgi:predicted dehydrogenase
VVLNVAIIGVSGYGQYVLNSFLPLVDEGRIRLCGATVINPEIVPETCDALRGMGCWLFKDYQEMLKSLSGEIDLCLIPTAIELHRPMACDALAHGAHILVEKPLAGCVADAEEILSASRRWNRRVAVGFQDLCSEPILEAKRRILCGEAGTLRSIRAIGVWPRGFAYYQRNAWAGCLWRDGKAVFDSPLNNAFGHLLNLAFFFAGSTFATSARPVDVQGELYRAYSIESFDTGAIHVTTEQNLRIDCYVSHAGEEAIPPYLIIECDQGRIEWLYEKTITLTGTDGIVKWQMSLETAPQLRLTAARSTMRAFEQEEPLVNSAESALSHVLAIEKLHAHTAIQNVPRRRIIAEADRLFIEGSANWLFRSFEQGGPLLVDEISDAGLATPQAVMALR